MILTPHVGGSTQEAQEEIGQFVAGSSLASCSRAAPSSRSTCPRAGPASTRGPGSASCTSTCPGAGRRRRPARRAGRRRHRPEPRHPRRAGYVVTDVPERSRPPSSPDWRLRPTPSRCAPVRSSPRRRIVAARPAPANQQAQPGAPKTAAGRSPGRGPRAGHRPTDAPLRQAVRRPGPTNASSPAEGDVVVASGAWRKASARRGAPVAVLLGVPRPARSPKRLGAVEGSSSATGPHASLRLPGRLPGAPPRHADHRERRTKARGTKPSTASACEASQAVEASRQHPRRRLGAMAAAPGRPRGRDHDDQASTTGVVERHRLLLQK